MAAYVIADIDVTDPVTYEDYKKLTPALIAAYGGKFVARGGTAEVLEGEWSPHRIVILEFENIDQNADGVIDATERDAHMQQMRGFMQDGKCGEGKCGGAK